MKKIRRIAIIGGGSSGWLAAAYLNYNFPDYDITIIDKEIGTPVGVGEATLLNFKLFLKNCGFEVEEWFDEMDATEKLGIYFHNWVDNNKHVYHPFYTRLTEAKKYKDQLMQRLDDLSNVAYHVNCGKLVLFLQRKLKNKITFKKSAVKEVVYKDDNIDTLILNNKQKVSADLYVDCTGFNSILKNKTEKIMLRDRLICDTAVAGQVEYKNKEKELVPYTKCEAVKEGWVWSIPVSSRIGSGFIFNRDITSIDQAKDFFVKHWKNRIKKENLKVIDWTPYYDKKIWNGNVVSIGLSAGFLEPLESTGLMLAMEGIYSLCKRIFKKSFNEEDIDLYNQHMKIFYENSIDFVNMHYLVSKRKGIFWEKGRQLKASKKFKLFKKDVLNKNYTDLAENVFFNDTDCFISDNWYCWLKQTL